MIDELIERVEKGEGAGWQSTGTAPQGVVVETKIDDILGVRNVQKLVRDQGLWWLPDGSMYVYYLPTHWRPLPEPPSAMTSPEALKGE